MNRFDEEPSKQSCVSDSPNAVIIYDEGDGDMTVRPIPPELLPQAQSEWQKIQEALASQINVSKGNHSE